MGESFWQEGFKIHLMNMDVNYKFLDTQKIIEIGRASCRERV